MRYLPSGENFCTLWLPQSATYTSPASSTVTPHGRSNSPSPLPWFPHRAMKTPSLVNFWTRWFRLSTMSRLPFGSNSRPAGPLSCPSPGALLPPSSDVLPFGVELEKREAGVRVEYLDPALVLVCAVDVAVAAYGDSDRPDELVSGEVCHVVFVDGHLADPREDVRPALIDRIPQATADDEQDVASSRRHVHRGSRSHPFGRTGSGYARRSCGRGSGCSATFVRLWRVVFTALLVPWTG